MNNIPLSNFSLFIRHSPFNFYISNVHIAYGVVAALSLRTAIAAVSNALPDGENGSAFERPDFLTLKYAVKHKKKNGRLPSHRLTLYPSKQNKLLMQTTDMNLK
jgi:hypothetical protein